MLGSHERRHIPVSNSSLLAMSKAHTFLHKKQNSLASAWKFLNISSNVVLKVS